ncbi:hypothetical protein N7528_005215 [Penicillium herquei]|nr:hypothetical protein N7528_005215 [Penicillium herquei]
MSNVVSKWTLFGPKPGDVIIAGDQANHFFPYQGDLCLAVGKSVWRKRHRSEGDPLINKAVNHWPSLYEDSWENMGNRCLPDANLLSVISYAALSMDCTDILSHLIILTRDGTIMVSNNDRLVDGASFRKMSNTSNETVTWKKITYWNDKVVGLDSNNCTWNLTINFVEHTYKADDKLQVRAFSEFTATDMGLVGLGENGILYRRIVNRNPGKEDANKSICTWESWMPHYGVTSIGVASPGARLDLHTLARILKSRYVETALALYPFFQKFSIFGVIHSVYIEGSLREVAKEYNKAYQNEKDEVAIKAGKKIGPHMKTLCKILARQAAMCHDTVAKILRDIDDIRPDLQYQRITIIDQVKSAEGFVKNLNSDYNKIDAWLWGPVETSVAGPEHALLKISSDLLVSTLDTLKRLEYFTKILHEFWNGMLTNVMMLQDMSLAAAKRLGEGILKSDSIEASNAATKSFIRRTQNLLAILNRDGIRLPIDDANSLMMHSSNRQR